VYRHDSVFIRERADTVFVDRYHTKISYRDRLRTDTVRITDTVRTVHSETVAVEVNRLTGWQRFQLRCGQFLITAVFLTAIYLFFKWKLKS
jgi:hypothetical protein